MKDSELQEWNKNEEKINKSTTCIIVVLFVLEHKLAVLVVLKLKYSTYLLPYVEVSKREKSMTIDKWPDVIILREIITSEIRQWCVRGA